MGTTADKLNKLLETKAAIKQAIIDKGVDVGEDVVFADYASKISAIESGSNDEFLALRTSNGTNMSYLFYYYLGTELDVSNFDTSSTTNMSDMFGRCLNLTELDLSNFNTINVTSMNNMFNNCTNLEILDIRNFDMRNVSKSNMNNMFSFCSELHTLRLDNCDNDTINQIISSSLFPTGAIDGVIRKIYVNPDNIEGLTAPENWIFVNCLTGEEIAPEIDIPLYVPGEFQKTGLTEVTTMVNESHTDLSNMFDCCYNLATINGIEQWNTSNVTKMNHMFNYCLKLIELDLSSFNTSKVTSTHAMFRDCANLEILDIRNFDMTNVTDMQYMFGVCYELQELRLDNCSNETINKIITSDGFPTDALLDVTRKIYVNPDNIEGLTAPKNWVFVHIG